MNFSHIKLLLLVLFTQGVTASEPDPLLVLAESGDTAALHTLCYQNLYGVDGRTKNPEQAFYWCSASAETGNSNSQTLLAEMYRSGIYVEKDDSKATQLYLLAANQGHMHAQFMLGRMALLNEKPDPYQFCYWTRAAVAQNYDKAIKMLDFVEQKWRKEQGDKVPGYCDTVMSKKAADLTTQSR